MTNRERERERRERATRPYRNVGFCRFELFLMSEDYSIFSSFVVGFLVFNK